MNKYLRVALTLASVACVYTAWDWVITFDPASPVVPFVLCVMAGFGLRQAID